MKRITIGICCLVLTVLLTTALWATSPSNDAQVADTVSPSETSLAFDLSVEEMVEVSDLILIGSCVEARSMWVDRNLVTLASISVKETLKGGESSAVTVVLPGGADANRKIPVAMTYPGAPRIAPSEDVFLFLTKDDELGGGYTIAGFSQGKFSIIKDEEGRDVVSRDLTDMTLKGKAGLRRGTATRSTLSGLRSQVMQQLRKQ
ncbi:MAG TPA: hypothetical protein VE262_23620 [Blastocatellia bacterium]|nr:hypothetical protein [Blastocatellia bacterium]